MIIRIVRMGFDPKKVDEFEKIFQSSKHAIRSFPGCTYLSLHKDHHQHGVYYTLSHWESQDQLDVYRNSTLFKNTWEKTKKLFNQKPQAYSLNKLEEV